MKSIKKVDIKSLFKERPNNSHKGDFGRVLVIGGSEDYVGAPYLAASSVIALRMGSDLVTVAAPAKVAWAINSMNPDIITKKLAGKFIMPKHLKTILALVEKSDVVLIGPGLGLRKETIEAVRKIVKTEKPKVIDADALKVISLQEIKNAILTPHRKEFEVLLKNSKLKESNFQKALGNNVILLKGNVDIVISSEKKAFNRTGNPGMTVGGTGDVLSGLCAGILAINKRDCKEIDLFEVACAGAYLSGIVGNSLKKKIGYGLLASDFLKEISVVLKNELY